MTVAYDGMQVGVELPNTSFSVGRMINERLYGSLDLTFTQGFKNNLASSLIYNTSKYRVAGKMQVSLKIRL